MEQSAIEEWVHSCLRCGNCKYIFRDYRASCPSGEKFKFETYFASGRIRIAQGIKRGEIKWDASLMDPLFACTTCGNCEHQCLAPHRNSIVDIIEEIRALAVDALGPLEQHKVFANKIEEVHNPYGIAHHNREMVEVHDLPEKAPLVYFIGCTSDYREIAIRDATISLLKKAGLEFTVVDERCCSSPLIRTGQLSQVKGLAEHNRDSFKVAGAERVVTSCSGCFRTMSKDYPKMGVDLDIEVVHISQLLQELFSNGSLKLDTQTDRQKIAWHDPCHLGKHMNVYEAPRQVLSFLQAELTEIRDRENSWCCGAGGGARAAYADWSLETAGQRVDEMKESGAQTVVSGCPFCIRNLRDADNENEMEYLDITELVDRHTTR